MGTTRRVHTFCRICQAACGIVVDVEVDGGDGDDGGAERVVRVTGDPDHPISHGYTCSKGRALPAMHHDPARLDHPSLRGRRAGWTAVLDDLGATLAGLVERHGPDAVAIYRSGGWAFDAAGRYLIDGFVRGLGSKEVYSSITLDTPPKLLVPDLVAGTPYLTPQPDRPNTDLLLLVGSNPVVSHGHAFSWANALSDLRSIRGRGGHVVVIDPRHTESAANADVHVAVSPGSDPALLAHLVREVLRERPAAEYLAAAADPASLDALAALVAPWSRAAAAARCGVPEATVARVAELVLATGRVSTICGTGTSMSAASNIAEWLAWMLNAVTGSLDRAGGVLFSPGFLRPQEEGLDVRPRFSGETAAARPHVRSAYGELPCAALADEIESGTVRALLVVGGNPVRMFPNADKTRRALERLDALAVVEVRRTETTEIATHVLPGTSQLERPDLPTFIDTAYPLPFSQYGARVVAPAAERRPTWWILSELAARMGVRTPKVTAETTDESILAARAARGRVPFEALSAAPSGLVAGGAPGPGWLIPGRLPRPLDLSPVELVEQFEAWSAASVAGDGARPMLLVNRRLPHQFNSDLRETPSQQRRPFPTLLVHRGDGEPLGVAPGTTVVVRSRFGATPAVVELSDAIRPGVVSLPHGWAAPDVNRLTSDADDLDAITGMPRLSGIPVTVEVAGAVGDVGRAAGGGVGGGVAARATAGAPSTGAAGTP